jgi:hypothetical protein
VSVVASISPRIIESNRGREPFEVRHSLIWSRGMKPSSRCSAR